MSIYVYTYEYIHIYIYISWQRLISPVTASSMKNDHQYMCMRTQRYPHRGTCPIAKLDKSGTLYAPPGEYIHVVFYMYIYMHILCVMQWKIHNTQPMNIV